MRILRCCVKNAVLHLPQSNGLKTHRDDFWGMYKDSEVHAFSRNIPCSPTNSVYSSYEQPLSAVFSHKEPRRSDVKPLTPARVEAPAFKLQLRRRGRVLDGTSGELVFRTTVFPANQTMLPANQGCASPAWRKHGSPLYRKHHHEPVCVLARWAWIAASR